MNLFMIVAGVIAVAHAGAALERPRLPLMVSGVLWLLYAIYEYQIAIGAWCDADCNIRVDLVFFFPILALATFWAYQSYMGRPGPRRTAIIILGGTAVFVLGLIAEGHGYGDVASIAVVLGLVAIVVYAIKSGRRSPTNSV
jgi:hypothetical protein